MTEGGTKRVDAVRTSLESVGGTLECFSFALGDTDVFGIADIPDEAAAAGKTPAYRPPGS